MLTIHQTIWALVILHLAFAVMLFVPLAVWIRRRKEMPWPYALGGAAIPYAVAMFLGVLAIVLLIAEPDPVMGMVPYGFFFLLDAFIAIAGALGLTLGAWLRLQLARTELERRMAAGKIGERDKTDPVV